MKTIINKIKRCLLLLMAIVIRLLIMPILLLVPKKKNRIIFLNVNRPYYENVGITFEYMAANSELDVYYLTDKYALYNSQFTNNIIFYPSFKSIFKLIRANVIVMDDYMPRFAGLLAFKAKRVQLWHGNGMKKIGWMQMKYKNKFLIMIRKCISGFMNGFRKFDIVYFTSEFAYKHRKNAFIFKKYKLNGQPRNDLIFHESKKSKDYINSVIPNYNGEKVILYVPTWRERKDDINPFSSINFMQIDEFCCQNSINFIVKFHPLEKINNINFSGFSNITLLDKRSDIYNLLYYVDVLITDYSSVYFDYLLLDRPLIFFPFDKDDYLTNQRDIVYNYDEITPGRHCFTTSELIEEIDNLLIKNNDSFKSKRNEITNLFYKYKDDRSRERVERDILSLLNLE